jgi:hypothetical protein
MNDHTDYEAEADREAVQQWTQRGTFVVDGQAREWILQIEDAPDHWLPVKRGETVYTFRGDPYVVTGGQAPRHEGSSGKVFVHPKGDRRIERELYPSVFNARWFYDFEG